MVLLTPNKPKTTKKSKNFTFLALWPLVWPLRPLLAFFQFSWNPWCLRSPVVWKNIISKQEIIKNNFRTRFSISVQCAVTGRTALFQERQFTGLCQDLMQKKEPLNEKRVLEGLPISAKQMKKFYLAYCKPLKYIIFYVSSLFWTLCNRKFNK